MTNLKIMKALYKRIGQLKRIVLKSHDEMYMSKRLIQMTFVDSFHLTLESLIRLGNDVDEFRDSPIHSAILSLFNNPNVEKKLYELVAECEAVGSISELEEVLRQKRAAIYEFEDALTHILRSGDE